MPVHLVKSLGILSLLLASPLRADDSRGSSSKPGGCVDVQAEASFASVGYDHIVTLKSACKRSMTCSVSTSVNPEPATVTLAPGGQESVTTWRGSPSREFTPIVSCSERKG